MPHNIKVDVANNVDKLPGYMRPPSPHASDCGRPPFTGQVVCFANVASNQETSGWLENFITCARFFFFLARQRSERVSIRSSS